MTRTDRTAATPRVRTADIALVAVGGAAGSVARFALWNHVGTAAGHLLSTLLVAVIGCGILGLALGATTRGRMPMLRTFAIGACGGFASFSLYAALAVTGTTAWFGVVYLVLTPIAAMGAMTAGFTLAKAALSKISVGR